MKASTKCRAGLALVTGATALGLTISSGPASAQYNVGTGPVKIKMALKGKRPVFTGPKRVSSGERLTVVNKTAPRKIGPHTLSLVKQGKLPKGKKERRNCFNGGICLTIAKAHEFNPQTEKIGKDKVEVGTKGWDKAFGKRGDSWYTEKKGAKHGRRVVAAPGTTLYFLCAVHPGMQRKIRVVE
jgi:hypothetical protein